MVESHSVAIPCKILAFYDAIFDGDVFCVPKRVLRVEIAVLEHGVFDILKTVFALEIDVFEADCRCTHHKILAFCVRISHTHAVR